MLVSASIFLQLDVQTALLNSCRLYITQSDLRTDKSMAKVDDVHHEDVTCVAFSKKDPQRLICGSDDGIVSTFDLSQPSIDEVVLAEKGNRQSSQC